MSDRKSIQQEIRTLSQRIQSLNEDMSQRNDLSVLDIDLLRKHTIDLYDAVNQLRLVMKENVVTPVGQKTESGKPEVVNVPVEKREVRNEPIFVPEKQEVISEPVVEVKMPEPVAEVKIAEPVMEVEINEPVEEAATSESLAAPEELAIPEPFLNQEVTEALAEEMPAAVVNEVPVMEIPVTLPPPVVEKPKPVAMPDEPLDLAARLSNAPINDLKRAISIAKKFEFINSLFAGNVEKYAYAIHRINNLNNGDEAFTYLHELKAEHKWDEEDSNFVELANMVRRRYLG